MGLDRLLAALEQLGKLPKTRTTAAIFIPFFDAAGMLDYFRLAAIVRAAVWGAEVYPEPKKLGQQLKYADQRGFRFALIAGADELAKGTCQIKNLNTKVSTEVNWKEQPEELLQALANMDRLSQGSLLA